MTHDVIVIGGGAAGVFCAIEAGRHGRRALVIEHNAEVGRKIIISGGGRCNFTNLNTQPENFVSANPHFARSALARYTPLDFIELVKSHRIEFYEKKLGQLFCRGRSREVVDMLLAEAARSRVRIETGCSVLGVERTTGGFRVETAKGRFECGSLVIATGGLSFPKVGATDLGYKIARQFGLKIEETRPSLVPLVFSKGESLGDLAGVSIDVSVSVAGKPFRENILFTHSGLSGPAILQASNYWRPEEPIEIDLLPDDPFDALLFANSNSKKRLDNFLKYYLQERFAEAFAARYLPQKLLTELGKRDYRSANEAIHHWRVRFSGTEEWDRAEVTLGGVSTDELSSRTMEVRNVPGLFFIGEVVDVTGWLGGYNFQWAWSSGYAAGNAA
jgi:predicted Rossmann fold flavoprotein